MTSKNTPKVVTFDCVGTLMDPWPSVGAVYAMAGERCGYRGLDPEDLDRRFGQVWKRLRRFDYTRGAWFEVVRETLEGLVAVRDMDRYFLEAYEGFGRGKAWRVPRDVKPCLEALQGMRIRMAVISNFDERLTPLLRELGLAEYFEVMVASGPLGVHKPSVEIFHHVCRQLGVMPEEAWHVGDRLEEDVKGARAAGMGGIWIDRVGSRLGERAGERLKTLDELVGKVVLGALE